MFVFIAFYCINNILYGRIFHKLYYRSINSVLIEKKKEKRLLSVLRNIKNVAYAFLPLIRQNFLRHEQLAAVVAHHIRCRKGGNFFLPTNWDRYHDENSPFWEVWTCIRSGGASGRPLPAPLLRWLNCSLRARRLGNTEATIVVEKIGHIFRRKLRIIAPKRFLILQKKKKHNDIRGQSVEIQILKYFNARRYTLCRMKNG